MSWLLIIMLSEVSQPVSETPASYAITYMWNLKKRYNELLYRTDTDSQNLKNLCFPKETGWGVGRWAGGLGWKCFKIGLWWSLYNYNCNKIHWLKKRYMDKNTQWNLYRIFFGIYFQKQKITNNANNHQQETGWKSLIQPQAGVLTADYKKTKEEFSDGIAG